MSDTVDAYIRGRQEGYFNVRLEYTILNMDQQSRGFFAKGYHIGKQNRQVESINESETQKNNYIKNRKAYITIMGYKAASKDDTVNSTLLKGDDKVAFEEGYKVGLLHKNGNMDQIKAESLETYLMVTGYEINEESYLVYLDMLKDYGGMIFQKGHAVRVLCDGIRNVAINELNQNKMSIYEKEIKRC